jgi:hypothetical protein
MSEILTAAGYPSLDLPHYGVGRIKPGILHGRDPYAGFQRAAGLQMGQTAAMVEAHPLFQEAMAAAQGRTIVDPHRLKNLFLIIVQGLGGLESRNIIEFGCYRGGSLLFFATLLARLYPEARVYGLDTFSGMPVADGSVDYHAEGDFSDASMEQIQEEAARLGLSNITLIRGLVQDTFPIQIPAAEAFGLAHIDLDIYHPIRYVQTSVWQRMTSGGYVVYDDATVSTCLGATQAVEELIHEKNVRSEQIYPHFVFRTGQPAAMQGV